MSFNGNHLKSSEILICWIGDTDLLVFGKTGKEKNVNQFYISAKKVWEQDKHGSRHASTFDTEIANLDLQTRNSSIILALNDEAGLPSFSKIILLTNRPKNDQKLIDDFCNHFAAYICTKFPSLAGKVFVKFVPKQPKSLAGVDGWNFQAVYNATKRILANEINSGDDPDHYWYNITPGTIAQSTTLILLGKELSPESNFIQVEKSRNRVDHCAIPFDIKAIIDKQATFVENGLTRSSKIIGKAPCFKAILDKVHRIASYPVTVLLTGPSGTGKEVIAREIHRLSGRPPEKFVAINCAMLSRETGMTELTGYFRGSYTDAQTTTPGKYHEANGGTLFLDEIGECPPDVQAELLRFLQPLNPDKPTEREWRLKGAQPSPLRKEERNYAGIQHGDIRVIAATNRNLLDSKLFRQDLYYRIETVQISVPSLEERKLQTDLSAGIDDIRDLADFFLEKCNAAFQFTDSQKRKYDPSAYEALRHHGWRGNVRELQNVVTRAVLLSENPTIHDRDIQSNFTADANMPSSNTDNTMATLISDMATQDITEQSKTFNDRIEDFKRIYCSAALKATRGNKKDAYTILKINPKTFNKLIGGT